MATPRPRSHEPMTPTLSADNMQVDSPSGGIATPPLKRKLEVDGTGTRPSAGEGKENSCAPDKRQKVDLTNIPSSPLPCAIPDPRASSTPTAKSGLGAGSLVELQKRKLVLKQSPHTFEIPRRKKLEFEAFLLDVQDGKASLEHGIPEEHHAVIVLAGQEATSPSDGYLTNHIKKVLDMKDVPDVIPPGTWSALIILLFRLKQYGFTAADLPTPSSSGTPAKRLPAALQIRCWEARQPSKFFSEEQLVIVRARMAERARAREEVQAMIKGLGEVEWADLLRGEKGDKVKGEKKAKDSPAPSLDRKSREGTAASGRSGRSASPVKKSKLTAEEEEAARVKQEERDAKKAEKEEKRKEKEQKEAAKAAEAEKKQKLMAKQKQTMSSFFIKPKVTPKAAVAASKPEEAGPSKPPKVQLGDFDRTFKPVTFRATVEWAPVNRFTRKRRSVTPEETRQASEDWRLSEHISHLVRKSGVKSSKAARLPKGLKSAPLYGSVGEVWLEHQDAADPRKVLNRLKNQMKFPWKTLAFDGQVRPPYSGTFTKKSVVVGPRTPFAQDPMFDYTYDSGDDWQDDEGGEDVDDNANLEPEEQDEEDDVEEGEFDDWLDDSDDVVAGEGDGTPVPAAIPVDGDADAPILISSGGEQPRLPMKVVKKREVQPKRVVKVVPTWRGPLWENRIGEGNEGMEGYRLQLLNDSIDPFTYTSAEPLPQYKCNFTSVSIGLWTGVKALLSVDEIHPVAQADHAKPALSASAGQGGPPPHATHMAPGSAASETTGAPTAQPKPRPTGPKVAFPASHLLQLLQLIEGNTRNMSDMISDLKTHFDSVASKVAIEFKVREVAVKQGKGKEKVWRVLPEAWTSVGVVPP